MGKKDRVLCNGRLYSELPKCLVAKTFGWLLRPHSLSGEAELKPSNMDRRMTLAQPLKHFRLPNGLLRSW